MRSVGSRGATGPLNSVGRVQDLLAVDACGWSMWVQYRCNTQGRFIASMGNGRHLATIFARVARYAILDHLRCSGRPRVVWSRPVQSLHLREVPSHVQACICKVHTCTCICAANGRQTHQGGKRGARRLSVGSLRYDERYGGNAMSDRRDLWRRGCAVDVQDG